MRKSDKKIILRLLNNIRVNDKSVFVVCACFTLTALIVPLLSIALPKVLIDYLTGPAPNRWGILWIVLAFFAAGAIFNFLQEWLSYISHPKMTALRIDYVREMIVKLLNMDYKYMESAAFFEERAMAFDATNDNNSGVELIYHRMFQIPQLVLMILLLSVFIGLASPFILLAIIINIAATSWASVAVNKYEYKKKELLSKHKRRKTVTQSITVRVAFPEQWPSYMPRISL